jgi:hypothetical protein
MTPKIDFSLVVLVDKKKIHRATKSGRGAVCGQDMSGPQDSGAVKGVFLVTNDLKRVTCHKCKYGVAT